MEHLLRNIYGAVFVLPKGAALSDAISHIEDLLDIEGRTLRVHIGSSSGNLPFSYRGYNTDHVYVRRSDIPKQLLDIDHLQQHGNRIFVIYQYGDNDESMVNLGADLGGFIIMTYLQMEKRSIARSDIPDKYYDLYTNIALPISLASQPT